MNNRANISIILVILLLLLSLGATSFYYMSFEKEKKKSRELVEQLDLAKEKKERIEIQLKKINKEKISKETKIKENQELISKLNDKLVQEIKAKELLKTEQDALRNKIIEISQEKKSIQVALDEKLGEIAKLQTQLDTAISEKDELEEEIAELPPAEEGTVDLEKIVITPLDFKDTEEEIKEEPKRPLLSSQVLLINQEYSFLVLNVGQGKGAQVGDVFEVFHGDTSLGRVQIEKAHERMSAANFLPGFNISQVNEGDIANRID